ncbi:MAG: reductive dehalogenase [Dehalococcoidia bacterium]|nr:MAG: reductive dehalogenase [Dehalococcoidia bacterium]
MQKIRKEHKYKNQVKKLKKHHSTLSRRDFLKLLGLGGAGLGAAAVSAPVVHDLDELMDLPEAAGKRPWFVREVDKPTCDVDWDIMQRFDYSEVMWAGGLRKALGVEEFERILEIGRENRLLWMQESRPGYTLKEVALHGANHYAPYSFLGPQSSPTPEALGIPRYEGTPEENTQLVRAFLRLHGASQVGFVELDTNTTEKFIYTHDYISWHTRPFGQGPRLDILDVDEPSEGDGYRVIPKKARWVIVYALRMSDDLMKLAPTKLGNRAQYYMYELKSLIQGQLQNFLRTLGYMGLGEVSRYNALGIAPAFAVMCGMGELSRMGHVITPEFGLRQRVFKLITDMPLAPGKPIDFGAMNFCRTCKKCADNCPPQAITKDTEPSWDTRGKPYHSPGVKAWYWPQENCQAYWRQIQECSICYAVCPLSKGGSKAIYHDLQRWATANTPVFNRFFRNIDDFLDFGRRSKPEEIEGWWDLDLPPWGYVD